MLSNWNYGFRRYRSDDYGATWTLITTESGLPGGSNIAGIIPRGDGVFVVE
jgi:hypothetical protein